MSTPSYKLYGFDSAKTRPEFIRYMFHAANIPFDDFRITQEEWPKYKPKMPMGQLPVLEIDGKRMLPQSISIGRYIAKKGHFYGATAYESALIDSICDLNNDVVLKVYPVMFAIFAQNDDLKEEEWNKVKDEVLKKYEFLEKTLKKNGTGWLVGKKITMADFFVAEFASRLTEHIDDTVLDDLPLLKKLVKTVHTLPGVKEYIADRPKTLW
uniref:glutathione transferase n=1 Tax=Plectus sambesii TaxID=2011161 RepID=A0A914VTD2_9BILA